MKAQIFIVIVVLLAGFVFVVQQLFLQYSALDVSGHLAVDDSYIAKSIEDSLNITMKTSLGCQESTDNIEEFIAYITKTRLSGGFVVEIMHDLDCDNYYNLEPDAMPLEYEAAIVGQNSETLVNGGFYSVDPNCESETIGWDQSAGSGTTFQYDPEGQCHLLDGSDSGMVETSNAGSPIPISDDYTFTGRMKLDQVGQAPGGVLVSIANGATACEIMLNGDGISIRDSSFVQVPGTEPYIDSLWHEWTMIFEATSGPVPNAVSVYRDGLKVVDDYPCSTSPSTPGIITISASGTSSAPAELHLGYISIVDGIVIPAT